MQKNPVKISAMLKSGAKLWEDSLRDATVWGLFCTFSFECHCLNLGFLMEPLTLLPFYFPATTILFLCLFTFLVILASLLTATKQTKPGQVLCSANALPCWFLQCGFPSLHLPLCCGLLSSHSLLQLGLWLCPPSPFLSFFFFLFAANDAAVSVKWLETCNTNVRNRKSLILVLLSAGFYCTCCSEFPILFV